MLLSGFMNVQSFTNILHTEVMDHYISACEDFFVRDLTT